LFCFEAKQQKGTKQNKTKLAKQRELKQKGSKTKQKEAKQNKIEAKQNKIEAKQN